MIWRDALLLSPASWPEAPALRGAFLELDRDLPRFLAAKVGKEGGVLERDARAAGGEAGEKADGQAEQARRRAAGMGRDARRTA